MESSLVGHVERPKVRVGFIPLIDCAPVLFADDKAKSILRGLRTETLDNAIRLGQVRHEVLGDDSLMRGFVKYPDKMFVDEATFTRKLYGE